MLPQQRFFWKGASVLYSMYIVNVDRQVTNSRKTEDLYYAAGAFIYVLAWFGSTCSLSLLQFFCLISFILHWNISIRMGVVSSRMTLPPSLGHECSVNYLIYRVTNKCIIYLYTFPVTVVFVYYIFITSLFIYLFLITMHAQWCFHSFQSVGGGGSWHGWHHSARRNETPHGSLVPRTSGVKIGGGGKEAGADVMGDGEGKLHLKFHSICSVAWRKLASVV